MATCETFCGVNRESVKRGIVKSATRQGAGMQPPRTAKEVLEGIQDGIFGQLSSMITNGKTVISTSEAGGTVTFHIPEGATTGAFMDLINEILEDMDGIKPRIKRLRQCYYIALP